MNQVGLLLSREDLVCSPGHLPSRELRLFPSLLGQRRRTSARQGCGEASEKP